ncbi:hypothetical protein Pmani_022074 [Petrolisthes manimaculis]|uniref:Uncharacterized protein n=1 Tax=Petrolisthes manimaculis TaxID=1843537 RepID=A0AAE1U4S8_9EUCA|nr:hypothetical protein Pmani_022074 [Petrolisthes manimaculis]
MGSHVTFEVTADRRLIGTVGTVVRFLACVFPEVNFQTTFPVASEWTVGAGKGFLSSVSQDVVLKMGGLESSVGTEGTVE